MASRLDRLVLLLDTGSPVVRNTAADQLADIQKAHPHELYNLLGRIVPFLRYTSWDTRVAAARAIGGIIEHVKPWDPNDLEELSVDDQSEFSGDVSLLNAIKEHVDDDSETATLSDRFAFGTFDITNVIKNGHPLLGSAGKEYDLKVEGLSADARLIHAKQNVTARLGLGAEFMDAEFLTASDVNLQVKQKSIPTSPRMPIDPSGAMDSPLADSKNEADEALSARQRNMLKRKAKMANKGSSNKVRVVDVSGNTSTTIAKINPDENGTYSVTEQALNDSKIVVEHKAIADPSAALRSKTETNAWPLDALAEILSVDLFDTMWEIRHGASMALREILRTQAAGAGRRLHSSRQRNNLENQAYLDDLACRICCVFALDRFGDYVADQVIAPVRESVSQTLAALLKHLASGSVAATFELLSQLIYQENVGRSIWEVTHGGMLGLKYLVAMRKDVLLADEVLLDKLVMVVFTGLGHQDDDVRAVAAATLIPVAAELIKMRPALVDTLLEVLWDCLAEMRDDLSASTGSVMDLLARLFSFDEVVQSMRNTAKQNVDRTFAKLIPRLYAFFRHTITTVRSAVLRAMRVLILSDGDNGVPWIDEHMLRLVFQNLLVEQNLDVLALSFDFWTLCLSRCDSKQVPLHSIHTQLLKLVMTPVGYGRQHYPLDRTLFVRPSGRFQTSARKQLENHGIGAAKPGQKKSELGVDQLVHDIDGPMLDGDVELVGFATMIQNRCLAAQGLGRLFSCWPTEFAHATVTDRLPQYLRSKASTPRYLAAILLQDLLEHSAEASVRAAIQRLCEPILASPPVEFFTNCASSLHALRAQCQNLCTVFVEVGGVMRQNLPRLAPLPVEESPALSFGLNDASDLLGQHYDRLRRSMHSAFQGQIAKTIELSRFSASQSFEKADALQRLEVTRILASTAGVLVRIGELPKKLNPIIKSLMESIKCESEVVLQKRSANSLAALVSVCHDSGRTAALDKLIKNLCAYLCIDAERTPDFASHVQLTTSIYTVSIKKDIGISNINTVESIESISMRIKRTGAQMTLEEMLSRFGPDIFAVVPKLQQCIQEPLETLFGNSEKARLSSGDEVLGQEVVDAMCILRDLMKYFHSAVHGHLFALSELILRALNSEFASVRFASASCLAAMCSVVTMDGMQLVVERILPMMGNAAEIRDRQGAIEFVHLLIQLMDVRILPYVIFLIVPVLGRMSDSDNDVRELATRTFAQLVKLVPLEAGIPDPPGMSDALLADRDTERKFIQQMLDGSKVEAFQIPVAIKADLRSYQQEGVNWLAFLNKYQLHGILCDDMGLGKTLQTICIVASDHHDRRIRHQENIAGEWTPVPSLVICPPTLTGHWEHELHVYAPFLTAIGYVGPRDERLKLQTSIASADVVVTSYDIVRNDIEFLSRQNWNYCILDEGHIIKNSKAKLTQAVKMIKAGHRLILSGTPIQNNVLELWSLFDFLMPGFLGTEKTFYARYAKPIANSRETKSSSRDHEAGMLALEALHKQVLPFLLRRLKEDVLSDLPPKIIQDYFCELSPLQQSLYNKFAQSQAQTLTEETSGSMDKKAKSHVFQALQYMRKLCNHPALVLKDGHPDHVRVMHSLRLQNTTLTDIKHGPKLLALRDLLIDCGLGSQRDNTSVLDSSVVSQHRALIFCQMKDMLDMVEHEVLKKLLPTISYMRLDGSTDPRNRQAAVQQFNADPSIDVLLLTTHVGGLGLNLTGADTVIFVEHDWNPMKDLQAMDRAHRLGQKKTVNVYRLITKNTLEEKIMGLQRFKLNIASSVVNQQNSGLATMGTDQILDLFNSGTMTPKVADATNGSGLDVQGNLAVDGSKAIFDDLQELHAQSEYADFDDLAGFVSTL